MQGSGVCGGDQGQDQKRRQVSSQVVLLEDNLSEMSVALDRLETQLAGVLRSPSPPSPGEQKDRAVQQVEYVPLAANLASLRQLLAAQTMRLESVLDRLEV